MIWDILKEYSLIFEEICFLFVLFNVELKKEKNYRIFFLFILVLIAITHFVISFDNFYKIIIFEILDCLAFFVIVKLPFVKKITYYFLSYFVCCTLEMLFIWLIINGSFSSEYKITSADNFFLLRLLLGLFLLIMGSLRWRRKKEISFSIKNYWYISLISCLFSILLGGFLFIQIPHNINDMHIIIQFSIILLGIILAINTIGVLLLSERRKFDKEVIYLQNEILHMQQEYYSELNDKQVIIRKMKHDMNAHLIMIDKLNQNNDKIGLQNYLNKMISINNKNTYFDYDTGNKIATILVNYFADLMKDHNIIFEFEGHFEKDIKMTEFEINSLLYNVLTNAYEECMRLTDGELRKVYMGIKKLNRTLMIIVKNSCRDDLLVEKNIETSKSNKDNHGYGIKIMSSIVENYNGEIKFFRQEKTWGGG